VQAGDGASQIVMASAMKLKRDPTKWLKKKSKVGFRGYPVGTVAFYGPNHERASKVAVSIIPAADSEPDPIRRWFSEGDVRYDLAIIEEMMAFLREHGAHTVAMSDGIIGCPHEEGIDYPEGEACPQCPYWAGRDRWSGR
jgi:hypothetical protein